MGQNSRRGSNERKNRWIFERKVKIGGSCSRIEFLSIGRRGIEINRRKWCYFSILSTTTHRLGCAWLMFWIWLRLIWGESTPMRWSQSDAVQFERMPQLVKSWAQQSFASAVSNPHPFESNSLCFLTSLVTQRFGGFPHFAGFPGTVTYCFSIFLHRLFTASSRAESAGLLNDSPHSSLFFTFEPNVFASRS